MRNVRSTRTVVALLLLAAMLVATTGAVPAVAPGLSEGNEKIDPFVLEELAAKGQADVFVKMMADAPLNAAQNITDRVQRLQFVYDALTAHADLTQGDIRAYLDGQGIRYQPFWINNSLFAYGADLALVQALAERSDVAYVRGNHQVPLHLPVAREAGQDQQVSAVEWGIEKINAPAAWASGVTGQGVVVASIDTGVRYTHEALVRQYRGNNGDGTFSHDYNWFDATGTSPSQPGDNGGHGTHTMGTIVGGDGPGAFENDIGVAPGAKWMAAKGCGIIFCQDAWLVAAAQWIACPTRTDGTDPDCSQAPHVVNNSWGGSGGDPWYQSFVRSWVVAGIVPVFSIGNSGSACNTASSPGDYGLVIGVGATDINDLLGGFSSKGPGSFPYRVLKPDFVAPGVDVRSSFNLSDTAYTNFSGTSMAAPHVTGTVALMKSANPKVGLVIAYTALRVTSVRDLGAPPGPDECGGRAFDVYPNFIYGWGRIDAGAAVDLVTP